MLFDEIEKAHPDVLHMLLQILEEGKITDSLGRKIDFRNTVIIMTSNVGADLLSKSATLGFGNNAQSMAAQESERILSVAKKYFKPEFLNRVDDLTVFRPLEKSDLEQIVRLEVEKLVLRLKGKKRCLVVTDPVIGFLAEKGFVPEYGARPVRHAVERFLEDPLAEKILEGQFPESLSLSVILEKDTLVFVPEETSAVTKTVRKSRRKSNGK